ncbi:MAG: TetR/AcrR family transcriptional regulator [Endomicrobiaceae bacterium]
MNNRETISKCALELFSKRGYDAVGIQEIIDAAGITKPTLYHYFGSKEGLLKAVLQEHFDKLYSNIKKAAVYNGDVKTSLQTIISAFFKFAKNNRTYYRMQLSMWFAPSESDSNKAVSSHNAKLFSLIEDVFAAAAKDHGNMKGRQSLYAATFLGMINTYIGIFFNGYSDLDDKFVQTILHQFMHGIFS